ncbi:MAG: hypothetical protein GXX99_04230 [Clostridiales bacterium]|nr:hypothetical protein [Clostridiales bacterium]
MGKTGCLLLSVLLLLALAACGAKPSGGDSEATSPPPDNAEAPSAQAPGDSKPPRVLLPEELLSAGEAADFVGCPVEVGAISREEVEGTGGAAQRYQYDLPKDIDYYESTILALLDITQNGLISAGELAAGHDAKWSYETTKALVANEITGIPGLGEDAFYLNETSQVHFLFRDYYVVVAFTNTKEQYSEAEDLALNQRIAAHIADALSLADVELS